MYADKGTTDFGLLRNDTHLGFRRLRLTRLLGASILNALHEQQIA